MNNIVAILTNNGYNLGAIQFDSIFETKINFEWAKFKKETDYSDDQMLFGFCDSMKEIHGLIVNPITLKTF